MKLNSRPSAVYTHEGAVAQNVSPELQLRRSVMTCLLWEDSFYESGESIGLHIQTLIPQVKADRVAAMAIEARSEMQLRHVPLLLARELAGIEGNGPLVADLLPKIIQRADELTEFLAIYWKAKREPLSAGVKRGLSAAFRKFNAYQLAKYNRDGAIKLRDVLRLCHCKPKDKEQGELWRKIIKDELESPDTWEVALSAGKDKKETFTRLLTEGKLGGLAVLRNLRNMLTARVDENLIRTRLQEGISRALPFRFVAAAKHAPQLEDAIEQAMFAAVKDVEKLPGNTFLLVDVSGSMTSPISTKSEMTRCDAATGLAILLREKVERCMVGTFSSKLVILAPRRGFALRDAMDSSQDHGCTMLREALVAVRRATVTPSSETGQSTIIDRLIVITDEQAEDGILPAWTKHAYMINVGVERYGISYGNGWTHIDGWSERILDYIRVSEEASC